MLFLRWSRGLFMEGENVGRWLDFVASLPGLTWLDSGSRYLSS